MELEINAGNQNLAQVTSNAWHAIRKANESPYLFRFGDMLCRLERDNGACIPKLLTQDRLRHELARSAQWYRWKGDKCQPAKPPMDVVKDMLATPNPPLPPLRRITAVPVFASAGQVEQDPPSP